MSHRRPPLLRALQLNTGVMVVEIAAGIGSNRFSSDRHRLLQRTPLAGKRFCGPPYG